MFLDFIEIGTSDFEAEIQKNDLKKGFSIEPIKYYLDRLPDKKDCVKMNLAVSNYDGNVVVNYLSVENITKLNLPDWVRGCNSINSFHPTVTKLLSEKQIDIKDIITSYSVECKSILTIITENKVSGVYYLKIDTEGHDTTILEHFYTNVSNNSHLPHVILFESNSLSKRDKVIETIENLEKKGYEMVKSEHDTLLKLNLKKMLNKCKFSEKIEHYYISDYPQGYNPENMPHVNTLEDAQHYCKQHGYSGVTFQNNRYEVRNGKHLRYQNYDKLASWIYI
jgi:FkbM family methyltransferase